MQVVTLTKFQGHSSVEKYFHLNMNHMSVCSSCFTILSFDLYRKGCWCKPWWPPDTLPLLKATTSWGDWLARGCCSHEKPQVLWPGGLEENYPKQGYNFNQVRSNCKLYINKQVLYVCFSWWKFWLPSLEKFKRQLCSPIKC